MKHGNAWRGGRHIGADGYIRIQVPKHSRVNNDGRVHEHRLIAEKALGKQLPNGAIVHHHGKKSDNTQLVICEDVSYHMLLHRRTRALKACGYASWLKCWVCKQYDKPSNLYIGSSGTAHHRACKAEYEKKRRLTDGRS